MRDVAQALTHWLDTMFGGTLPDNKDQPSGTALAVATTFSLGQSIAPSSVLYCAPKRETTIKLLEQHGIPFQREERFVDFLIEQTGAANKHAYVVACESEMCTGHGCGSDLGLEPYYAGVCRSNGYAWDFCKLLHFPAPHLLFFARLKDSDFPKLETSLNTCAKDYRQFWHQRRLSVVLLPAAKARRTSIRLGAAQPNGAITFESLGSVVA
jgi:hypothetical protein